MMKQLILALFIFPAAVFAQDHGIIFSQLGSWEDVLQKARAEHKYVFVDCYASWCGPCKEMDRTIFTNDTVGKFMNKWFIAVKVQIDQTKKDPTDIKNWYGTADNFQKQYAIIAFPSFLFFAPDGAILHKGIGEKGVEEFLDMAKTATDPQQQYYTLMRKYENRELPYSQMPNLATTAKNFYEDSAANRIAADYIELYLVRLPEDSLWTRENISFIQSYRRNLHTNGKLFESYCQKKDKIDIIMGERGFSNNLINAVVYADVMTPAVTEALAGHAEPKWNQLTRTIAGKYGDDCAQKIVLKGRVVYYKAAKQWKKYAKYMVIRFDNAGIVNYPAGGATFMVLNNIAFEVFKYSDNRKELKRALVWVDRALSMDSTHSSAPVIDTKANLLYKLGKKQEAVMLEEESVKLDPDNKEFLTTVSKMKNGEPTWITK
jgi:thioredoxin-related protein